MPGNPALLPTLPLGDTNSQSSINVTAVSSLFGTALFSSTCITPMSIPQATPQNFSAGMTFRRVAWPFTRSHFQQQPRCHLPQHGAQLQH